MKLSQIRRRMPVNEPIIDYPELNGQEYYLIDFRGRCIICSTCSYNDKCPYAYCLEYYNIYEHIECFRHRIYDNYGWILRTKDLTTNKPYAALAFLNGKCATGEL